MRNVKRACFKCPPPAAVLQSLAPFHDCNVKSPRDHDRHSLLILDSLPQLFHVIDLIMVRKCGLAESPHRIVDSVQF